MLSSKSSLTLMLLVLPFALISCGGGGGNEDSTSGLSRNACPVLGLSSKIFAGTACDESNSPVVPIIISGSGHSGICSGTMISSTDVLSAGHCVTDWLSSAYITSHGRRIYATQVALHPDYFETEDAVFNDVSIFHLESAAGLPVVPLMESVEVRKGDKISIFGYGGVTDDAENTGAGELRSGEMEVTDVTSDHVISEFNGDGTNTCPGDSGGPALLSANGKVGIVGVTSSGRSSGCGPGDRSLFANTQNRSVRDFIERTVRGVPEA